MQRAKTVKLTQPEFKGITSTKVSILETVPGKTKEKNSSTYSMTKEKKDFKINFLPSLNAKSVCTKKENIFVLNIYHL